MQPRNQFPSQPLNQFPSQPLNQFPSAPTPHAAKNTSSTPLRIRAKTRRGGHLLIDLPIGTRLTLGFLIAGLIASLITGAIGLQQTQSLSNQSDFYENLLQINTNLTTAASFLQLMNAETNAILTLHTSQQPSQATLDTDLQAVQGLVNRYTTTINDYANHDLLVKHPEQVALLATSHHEGQVQQQITLTASILRTWQLYQNAQSQILQYANTGQIGIAGHLEQVQGEFTNADALSALRALIRFNNGLSSSIHDTADVEGQTQLFITIIGAIIAFMIVVLIGWFISSTIVRRLHQLRLITQAVEQGQLNKRIKVVGSDEIADVSASVNAMLEAIVGLLEESRNQRDAMTNAAEHLFSDMRVVSAGDLRINAPVSNDPIGMLANAFNFTVGRFRRSAQRIKAAAEQLDVIARQGTEHSEAFQQSLQLAKLEQVSFAQGEQKTLAEKRNNRDEIANVQDQAEQQNSEISQQVRRAREHLQNLSTDSILRHTRAVEALIGQITTSIGHMEKTITIQSNNPGTGNLMNMQIRELRTFKTVLAHMNTELQVVQKNTLNGLNELDSDLDLLAATIRTSKVKSPVSAEPPREAVTEVLRASSIFTNDIITMSRQLAGLAYEIRTSIVTFQLDSPEIRHQPNSTARYNLADDKTRSSILRSKNRLKE